MKLFVYALFTLGTVFTLASEPAQAASRHTRTDSPAEAQRKEASASSAITKKSSVFKHNSLRKLNIGKKVSHAMRVLLGLEESKAVTSPAKRNRQLHAHQRHLRMLARMASPSRR